jgi:hypothetical protein
MWYGFVLGEDERISVNISCLGVAVFAASMAICLVMVQDYANITYYQLIADEKACWTHTQSYLSLHGRDVVLVLLWRKLRPNREY